jgi:hypothetical protein
LNPLKWLVLLRRSFYAGALNFPIEARKPTASSTRYGESCEHFNMFALSVPASAAEGSCR